MKIPQKLRFMWAETLTEPSTTHGFVFGSGCPDDRCYDPPLPPGVPYMTCSADPRCMHETVYSQDGKQVGVGSSSWPTNTVLAMVRPTLVERLRSWFRGYFGLRRFPMDEAVFVAARSCERCLNVLSYEYGTTDGYPELSDKWMRCGTVCDFCRHLPRGVRRAAPSEVYVSPSVHKSVPPCAEPDDDCHALEDDRYSTS